MNSSNGLGQPGPGQPDFDGPQGQPQQPHPESSSGPGTAHAPQQYSDPQPRQSSYPPGQPSYPQAQPGYPQSKQQTSANPAYPPPAPGFGRPGQPPFGQPGTQPFRPGGYPPPVLPPPRRPTPTFSRGLVLAGVLIGLLIVGLLGWQFLGPKASQQPSASASPATSVPATAPATPTPRVTRASVSPQPANSTPVTGGGIGQTVDFKTRTGSGKVTITKAIWADNGVLEPTGDHAYLIVDLTLEGVSGEVTTGPFFTSVVDVDGDNHMLTIGARLDNQLPMRTLRQGDQNTGQIAFELTRSPVTFQVLDALLEPVATVDVPGR